MWATVEARIVADVRHRTDVRHRAAALERQLRDGATPPRSQRAHCSTCWHTDGVDEPKLRSPLARAVVPVLAGIGFFVVLGLILWGVAVFSSRNPENVKLGDQTFVVSRVDRLSDRVKSEGPVLFPDLKSKDGTRSVVIDHVGGEDASGWVIYNPFPADRGDDCIVTQRERTASVHRLRRPGARCVAAAQGERRRLHRRRRRQPRPDPRRRHRHHHSHDRRDDLIRAQCRADSFEIELLVP